MCVCVCVCVCATTNKYFSADDKKVIYGQTPGSEHLMPQQQYQQAKNNLKKYILLKKVDFMCSKRLSV